MAEFPQFHVYGKDDPTQPMTQHLTSDEIAAFQAQSLPPDDLFRVWRHASGCEACDARLRQPDLLYLRIALAKAELEGRSAHLTYDDIAGYVDGRLAIAERRRVEDHIAGCRMCAKDVRAIADMRDDLDQTLQRSAQPPVPSSLPIRETRPSPWLWTAGVGAAIALAATLIVTIFVPPHRHSETPVPSANSTAPAHATPVPSGSTVQDGGRLLSLAKGSVSGLDGLPDAYHGPVIAALSYGSLEGARSPFAPASRSRPGALMGDDIAGSGVSLLSPVNEVVQEQNPLLTWTHTNGAVYQVSVGDRDFREVAHSGWIQESSWRVPILLERGRNYEWQLLVRRGGKDIAVPAPPHPPARFQVLPTPQNAELEALGKTFGDSHLVMGIAFARYGMWGSAASQFEALQRQNPESPVISELVRNLDRRRHGRVDPDAVKPAQDRGSPHRSP